MSENKPVIYVAIALILTLAAMTVYWYKSQQKNPRPSKTLRYAPAERAAEPLSADYDFVSMLDGQGNAYVPAENGNGRHPIYSDRMAPAAGVPYTQTVLPGRVGLRANPSIPAISSTTPFSYGSSQPPTASSVRARNSMKPYASHYGAAATSTPLSAQNRADAYQQAVAQEREAIWDSYMPKQTRQQQKALNQQLNAMSAGIDRAIAKAMLPKSKREQNIEKYLAQRGEAAQMDDQATAAQSGQPGAGVINQIASQAKQVVGNMKQAYGDGAAEKASQIMNDFQSEMAQTLSKPGDPQEKQIRAIAINNKYNQKLQQLNQQEGFKQMENQLRAENEKLLAQLRTTFNPETEAAARAIMEEALKKRMEIMAAGYSEEEAYSRLLALEEQQRKDLEQLVQLHNPNDVLAVPKLRQLENQAVKNQILDDDQEGQYIRVKEETLQKMDNAWQKENDKILKDMEAYGPQVYSQAQQILDRLRQKRLEIFSKGGDEKQLNRKNMELTEQANQDLAKLLFQSNQKEWIENATKEMNAQNTEILRQYTSQMKELPNEVKQEWSQKARPILEKYNALRAQVWAQSSANPNYEQDLKRLDEQQQEELIHITLGETAAQ